MEKIVYSLESEEIKYLCGKDKHLAKIISVIGPLEYSVNSDYFAFLVHEIVEQMLSVKAGNVIYARLVELCNGEMTPEEVLKHSAAQMRMAGLSYKKANCILELATKIFHETMNLSVLETLSNDEVIKELTKIRGIGVWTAKMYLIFSLNRMDVLPYEDKAFLQSYRWMYNTTDVSPNSVSNRCKKWSPYASIAARYMYKALDSGLTKNHFHLYK